MARTSRMVSNTACAVAILFAALALYFVLGTKHYYHYPATDDALDGAVVSGITKVTKRSDAFTLPPARIVIVPHHLVAAETIAEGVARIHQTDSVVKTVLILSPDHFGKCTTLACTSRGSFKTFFGGVEIDDTAVSALLGSDLFSESQLFRKEHGVFSIVPFVKHYLPEARVVPIVVSVKGTEWSEQRVALAELLEQLLQDEHTALIVSTDFSHYLGLAQAELRDVDTRKVLCSRVLSRIRALDNPSQSDCPLCVWVATTLGASKGTPHPYIFAHTNSATLLRDVTAQETTSHFGVIYSATADKKSCPEEE